MLSDRERRWVDRYPARWEQHFRHVWVGKEAVAKALGTGLRDVPSVRLAPRRPTQLVDAPSGGREVWLTYLPLPLPLPLGPGHPAEVGVALIGRPGAVHLALSAVTPATAQRVPATPARRTPRYPDRTRRNQA